MSPGLQAYLEFDRLMRFLDAQGTELADSIRDAMDPLWYQLTADERRWLDERSVGLLEQFEGVRVPVGPSLFQPEITPAATEIPRTPIAGWKVAA